MRGPAWMLLGVAALPSGVLAAPPCPWMAGWASAQMRPDTANSLPAGALSDGTLRQIVRPSIGGTAVRVRLSNAFGTAPLHIGAATLARSAANATSRVDPASITPLRFGGSAGVVIPAGADWLSDPIELALPAFADLAVSLHVTAEPAVQTSHPGSRATSHVARGDQSGRADLDAASAVDHWYLLSGIEVRTCAARPGIVVLGDSITDGRGSTTNGNDRWTDVLARRLKGRAAVINQGIGGNRLLLDGLGPNALARLDRDVLALPGIGHLIVLEGINDIGTLSAERPASAADHRALVARVTAAYAQIVARARARGLTVHGATILPFAGSDYARRDPGAEASRQAVNAWIRAPGHFDHVIDFDQVMRDPTDPGRLNPAYDTGDRLHPNPAGYRAMGEAVATGRLR